METYHADLHSSLDKIQKAAMLLRQSTDVKSFRDIFAKIVELISDIPGHDELVRVNNLSKVEDWQIEELKESLIEQLNKTKLTMQSLLRTGYGH